MTRKLRLTLSYAPFALGIWACTVASAADGQTSHKGSTLVTNSAPAQPVDDAPPAPHRPPQAAFDACKSLGEGDACSVSFNGHTMPGTCRKGPNGEAELACAPAHPPGPPPEAVEACKGAAEGASCSMTTPDGQSLTGKCSKGPHDSDVVACAPPRPSGPPPSDSNNTMSSTALEQQLDQLEHEIRGN